MKEIKIRSIPIRLRKAAFSVSCYYSFSDFVWHIFQQLYNTADAVVVGRFVGKQALAAVGGTTSTLINLLVGFSLAFPVVRL